MKKLVKINGMHCLECKMKLEDAFNVIDGVKADVDFESQIASLTIQKKMSDDEIMKVISSAGFDGVIL